MKYARFHRLPVAKEPLIARATITKTSLCQTWKSRVELATNCRNCIFFSRDFYIGIYEREREFTHLRAFIPGKIPLFRQIITHQDTYCSPVAYTYIHMRKRKTLIARARLTDTLAHKFLLAVRAFCAPPGTFLSSQWSINYFPNYCQAVDRVLRIISGTLRRSSAASTPMIKLRFQRNILALKSFSQIRVLTISVQRLMKSIFEMIKMIMLLNTIHVHNYL